MADLDHYEAYYADKLWNLLPAIYRTLDTDQYGANGPLRELVNRIGAQAAILRRSIDRLWDDQSIESCDDWVIPYIGDLLATNLVASLDSRGQRIDVAKTIYYRRRKGTLAVLEEIAHDITGWDAKVVEFFRRMGRTRHLLDPEIGFPAATDDPIAARGLQLAEGLVGPLTNSTIGGYADLRNVYGATKAESAFDEFFHTADFRQGTGQFGWHNIPRLGVFLWTLLSLPVGYTTPVADHQCHGQYTFDPTGRNVPLFAQSSLPSAVVLQPSPEDSWSSPAEWQLPTPISLALLRLALANPAVYSLYAAIDRSGAKLFNSLGVFSVVAGAYNLIPGSQITADPNLKAAAFLIDPVRGRLIARNYAPAGSVSVRYYYGFPSKIGAGPYDRHIPGAAGAPQPGRQTIVIGGINALAAPLAAVAPTGTVTINDFLTYTSVATVGAVTPIVSVTVRAENQFRPLVRMPAHTEWIFEGGPDTAPGTLALEGLFVSGGDIVLRGAFSTVTLTCCTFDPGSAGATAGTFAQAADGRGLVPCHLWVEGSVQTLVVNRCILGPIQTTAAGEVENLNANDSIIQALNAESAIALVNGAVNLWRCTLLGPASVHRLEASECILDDMVTVDDTQHGCVRFSAFTTNSVHKIPRQYESVQIAPVAAIFTSRNFGQPGYGQLSEGADNAIVSNSGGTIIAGATDGSEMGAYARNKNPIKKRSILIKYNEYMPLGLAPVLIDASLAALGQDE